MNPTAEMEKSKEMTMTRRRKLTSPTFSIVSVIRSDRPLSAYTNDSSQPPKWIPAPSSSLFAPVSGEG